MPTLTQLEYLVAVDRLRHFGKAAKACHVSQPSLSMQIQKVEDELGFLIFDRDKKPVLPTEKGQRILEQAKVVLREHARLLHLSKDEANEVSGDFSLAVIPTLAPYIVPLFIESFSQRYPKVRLSIDEVKTDEIISQLRDDLLDAGILATPLGETALKERVLFYEPFYLYVNGSDPLSTRKRIRESDIDGSDLWLLQDGHCFRNQVINFCAKSPGHKRAARSVSIDSGNFETLRQLIRKGHGYTLFPHLFVSNMTDSEQKAYVRSFVAPPPSREVSLVHRREHWKSDIIKALETTIREALPEELQALDKRKLEVLSIESEN